MRDRRVQKPTPQKTTLYKLIWFLLKAFVIYLAIMAHIPGAFALRAETRGPSRAREKAKLPSISRVSTATKVVEQPVIFSSDGKHIFTAPVAESALMEQLQTYLRHVASASLDAAHVKPTADTRALLKLAGEQLTPIIIDDPFLVPIYREFKQAQDPMLWANQLTKNPQALKALELNAFRGDFDAASVMGFYYYATQHYEDGMAFLVRSVMLALNYHGHEIDPTSYIINFLKIGMKELKRQTREFEIDVNSPEFMKRKPSVENLINVMEDLNKKIEGMDKPLAGHKFGVKQLHQMVNISVKTARELYSKNVVEEFSDEEKNVTAPPAQPSDQPRMADDILLKQLYAFGFKQLALRVIKASPKTMEDNQDGGASYSSRGVQLDWRPQTVLPCRPHEDSIDIVCAAARSGNDKASAYLSDYFFELYSKDPTPTGKRSLSFWPLALIEQACLQHERADYHEKALALYADLPEQLWPTTQIYIVIWHATRWLDLSSETQVGELSPKVRALVTKYGDKKVKKPIEVMFDPHLDPVVDETQDLADLNDFVQKNNNEAVLKKYANEKQASFYRVVRSAAQGDVKATMALSYYYYKIKDRQKALATATQALMLRRAYPDTLNLDPIGWFVRIGMEYLQNLADARGTVEFNLYRPEIESLIDMLEIFNQKLQRVDSVIGLQYDLKKTLEASVHTVNVVRKKMGLNQFGEKLAALKQKEGWLHIKFGALLAGLALTLWTFIWLRGRHQKQMKRIVPPIKKALEKVQPEEKPEPVVEQREVVKTETPEEKTARLAAEKAQREAERQERERNEQAEKAKNYKDALSYVAQLRDVVTRFAVIPQAVQTKIAEEKAKLPDLTKQMQANEKVDNKTKATAQWKKDKKNLQTQIDSCDKHLESHEETLRIHAVFIKEAEVLLKNCEAAGGIEKAYPFETKEEADGVEKITSLKADELHKIVAGFQSKQNKLEKEVSAVAPAQIQPEEEHENSEENDRFKKCQKDLVKLKKEFRAFSQRFVSDINGMRHERDPELVAMCDKATEVCYTWVDWLENKKFEKMEKDYFMSCVEWLVETEIDLKVKREDIRQRYEDSLADAESGGALPLIGNINNDNNAAPAKQAEPSASAVAQSLGGFLEEVRRASSELDFPGQKDEKEKRREQKAKARLDAAAKKQEEARNPIAVALDARMRDMQQMLREKDFKDHRLLLHRALQYRMVRLMLLLEIIVKQKNEEAFKSWYQNLAAHFTSDEYERFAKKFSNRIVHYYFVMGDKAEDFETKGDEHPDPDGLLSCVKECFATREKLSKRLPEKIKKTKLWKMFKDIEKSEPRSADVLFEECVLKLREFLHFHLKFREKYDNPVKLPIFNSACKMLLMLIGENFARLCDLDPELNALAKDENAADPAHQMIIDLNRLRYRRNLEKHEMDLRFDSDLISDGMIKEFQAKADSYCQLLLDLRERIIPRVAAVMPKK